MVFARPNFNQFCLCVSLAVWVFSGLVGSVCAHEYEDGFVERSLTITIRDGVGYGEYQIGLNGNTAAQILEMAEKLRQRAVLEGAAEGATGSSMEDAVPVRELSESDGERKSLVEKAVAGPVVGAIPAAAVAKQAAEPVVGVAEHLTDLATIKRFGELQRHWFAGRLRLTGNGRPVAISKVSIEPAARHPFSVLVKFQFSVGAKQVSGADGKVVAKGRAETGSKAVLVDRRVVDFRVADGLFSGHSGATRYALRSRGSTMVLQSNVAPVLVRADRVEVVRGETVGKERGASVMEAKLLVGGR